MQEAVRAVQTAGSRLRGLATTDSATRDAVGSGTVGALLGALISSVVNSSLFEISNTPCFASLFGIILVSLGSLMVHRKLWDRHEHAALRA